MRHKHEGRYNEQGFYVTPKATKQRCRDMYQIKKFSQAASKEALTLEFRAKSQTAWKQNICSISQKTDRVKEEGGEWTVTSSAFSYQLKFCATGKGWFFLELFAKADTCWQNPVLSVSYTFLLLCIFAFKNEDLWCKTPHCEEEASAASLLTSSHGKSRN